MQFTNTKNRNYKYHDFKEYNRAFFASAMALLQSIITAIGVALGVMGCINLFEGFQSDNPANKSQGFKQAISGAGIILAAQTLIPLITI